MLILFEYIVALKTAVCTMELENVLSLMQVFQAHVDFLYNGKTHFFETAISMCSYSNL